MQYSHFFATLQHSDTPDQLNHVFKRIQGYTATSEGWKVTKEFKGVPKDHEDYRQLVLTYWLRRLALATTNEELSRIGQESLSDISRDHPDRVKLVEAGKAKRQELNQK
jgi:hypothetical protein